MGPHSAITRHISDSQVAFIRKALPLSSGEEGLAREPIGYDCDSFKSGFLKKRIFHKCDDFPELMHIKSIFSQDYNRYDLSTLISRLFKAHQ